MAADGFKWELPNDGEAFKLHFGACAESMAVLKTFIDSKLRKTAEIASRTIGDALTPFSALAEVALARERQPRDVLSWGDKQVRSRILDLTPQVPDTAEFIVNFAMSNNVLVKVGEPSGVYVTMKLALNLKHVVKVIQKLSSYTKSLGNEDVGDRLSYASTIVSAGMSLIDEYNRFHNPHLS